MRKNKNLTPTYNFRASIGLNHSSNLPLIEITGNRRVLIEGSTGILLYERENIKINTNSTLVSFNGRELTVRCISDSCVEIEGFITAVEFIC